MKDLNLFCVFNLWIRLFPTFLRFNHLWERVKQ